MHECIGMITALVLATEHLHKFDSAEIVHAMVDRPCALRWVMPSYETNPITSIARTCYVAGTNHYKHVHMLKSVGFRLIVINQFVRSQPNDREIQKVAEPTLPK